MIIRVRVHRDQGRDFSYKLVQKSMADKCSSTAARDITNSRASFSTVSAANSASATARARRIKLGALGLVVNLVVLWNTIYMDAAVKQLSAEGYEVKPEDIARLSPLGHKHVNMLGRYAFTLPDTVARGELRPLRDPQTAGADEA
jgi:Tn3 transposase DDE domain